MRSGNVRNSFWNTLDLLIAPAALLALSPVLIARMGTTEFGLWMLINSFIGFTGALNLGLGDATIRYAAHHQAEGGRKRDFAETILCMFLVLGTVVGGLVVVFADVLIFKVFTVDNAGAANAITSMRLGGLWLGLKLMESGCVALVKGSHRFDMAARVTILENVTVIGAALVLTSAGFGLRETMLCAIATACVALARLLAAVRHLFDMVPLRAALRRGILRQLASFSSWAWLQGIAGAIFNQADKLLVGAGISVASLSVYVVCLQIGQLIHALFAAGSAFLFPLTSHLVASRAGDSLTGVFTRSMAILVPAATVMTVMLYLAAGDILFLAFGEEFATSGAPLLRLNAIAFGGLALSVIPYYLINGAGLIRINVVFSISSAVIIVALLPYLIETFGLLGGGVARVINFAVIIPYLVVVKMLIVRDLGWLKLMRIVGGFLVPVGGVIALAPAIDGAPEGSGANLAVAVAGGIVAGALSVLMSRTGRSGGQAAGT